MYILYNIYIYIYSEVIVSEGFSWDGHVSVALREALLIWTSRLNISCGLQWNSTILSNADMSDNCKSSVKKRLPF